MPSITTLATDLDGTLIPLERSGYYTDRLRTLKEFIREQQIQLLYVSGRSWRLIRQAIDDSDLPTPDASISDVGTTIHIFGSGGHRKSEDYADRLGEIMSGWSGEQILEELVKVDDSIWAQPDECQSEFKTSFFFKLAEQERIYSKVKDWIQDREAPVSTVVSKQIDGPLGLIDVLPKGVDKGFALRWWLKHNGISMDSAVYCGDSGNDSAAMTCGVKGVVVGNADDHLRSAMRETDHSRIYFAEGHSTAGVLEGLLHFHSSELTGKSGK